MQRMARTPVFSLLAWVALFAALPADAQRRACPRIPSVTNDPLKRGYRAGDIVPAELLDPPFAWSQCDPPGLPAGAARSSQPRVVFLSVTVDETGTVVDARPRGAIDPEGYYDAAVAAIRNWRTNKPQWRGLPVRASIAVDVTFARAEPAPEAATPPPPTIEPASGPATASGSAVPAPSTSNEQASERPISQVSTSQTEVRECPRIPIPVGSGGGLTQTYRAGDMVPSSRLDERIVWAECPHPNNKSLVMLSVAIDESGLVLDVKERAPSPEIEAVAEVVRKWRASPPPRHRGLPVKTMVSVDFRPSFAAASQSESSQPPLMRTEPRSEPQPVPQQAPMPSQPPRPSPAPPAGEPFVVEYYYKVKWGYADEFWRLFNRNHWPLLRKQIELGRILQVRAESPRYHPTEDGRWDYRVTIVFRSAAEANAPFDTESLERQLFPDLDSYRREERRRFELLLAHWDVPIVRAALEP